MGDQRYRYNTSGRRSPPLYNPARASMPAGMSANYSSFYGGDIHVIPTYRQETGTTRHHHHHNSADWRGANVPLTTTTHYTVRKDPVTRSASVRDSSRTRRATVDSASKRSPIIITTKQAKEPAASSHTPSSAAQPTSPPGRDLYRTDDGAHYYTQPASSIRSRSHTRNPYSSLSATLDNEEFLRLRQRTGGDERLLPTRTDSYRERPTSIYANMPRHSATTIDVGDADYEYTTPSALARYDLDNDRPGQRRRRDSFDRNAYYRPTVSVSTDINRPYEGRFRGGPPPTTWGLDKVNSRVMTQDASGGLWDRPSARMPTAPVVVPVPVPDVTHRSGQLDVPPGPAERVRGRPVSLYQDVPTRPQSRNDDLYRAHDDGYVGQREGRDYFHDDNVSSRGFGLRVEPDKKDELRDRDYAERAPVRERRVEQRRDSRLEERDSKRRLDDDLDRRDDRKEADRDRKYSRDTGRVENEARLERKGSKDDHDRDDDREKIKIKDKVATGLSLAAGAIGLGGALNSKDKAADRDDKETSKARRAVPEDERRREEVEDRYKSSHRESDERRRSHDDLDTPGPGEKSRRDRKDETSRERNRREAEARLSGEPAEPASREGNSSGEEGKLRKRRRQSSAFKPSDTAGLMVLKEQLKAKEESDKERDKSKDPSPDRRSQPSPSKKDPVLDPAKSSKDDERGRDAEKPPEGEKQVRLVSPPREKDEKKPIKGILKPPKAAFPEEPNPVREGVAPHKDDKTHSNVPPGARWTKISRKLVNPDALTIGKERFEVRDDFVIVLRVLNKEEIEAYTAATAQLRDMRRREVDKEKQEREERENRDDRDDDGDGRRRAHRSHRRDPRDEEEDERRYQQERERERRRDRERERERERDRGDDRSRRHRYEEDEEPPRAIEYNKDDDRYRSYRHRSEREREAEAAPVRRD